MIFVVGCDDAIGLGTMVLDLDGIPVSQFPGNSPFVAQTLFVPESTGIFQVLVNFAVGLDTLAHVKVGIAEVPPSVLDALFSIGTESALEAEPTPIPKRAGELPDLRLPEQPADGNERWL